MRRGNEALAARVDVDADLALVRLAAGLAVEVPDAKRSQSEDILGRLPGILGADACNTRMCESGFSSGHGCGFVFVLGGITDPRAGV